MPPYLECGPNLPKIPGPFLPDDFLSVALIAPTLHPTPAHGLSKCKFASKRIDLFLFLRPVGYKQYFAFSFNGGKAFFSFGKTVPCYHFRKVNIERDMQRTVDFAAGWRKGSL